MQNEPNSRRRRTGRGGRSVGRGTNVRNEANCPKRGTEAVSRLRIGDRPAAGQVVCVLLPRACAGRLYKQTQFAEPIVRNEPNFGGVDRRAEYPAFHYSIIPPSRADACCAKQSQFPGDAKCDGAWGTGAVGCGTNKANFPTAGTRTVGVLPPPLAPRASSPPWPACVPGPGPVCSSGVK
jgi:hypothetical protein